MRWRLWTTVGLFLLITSGAGAQTSAERRAIQVEINYTGAGTVDARHKIYVALWESSDSTNAYRPARCSPTLNGMPTSALAIFWS